MKKLFFSLVAAGMLMTSVGYVSAMESEDGNSEPKASVSDQTPPSKPADETSVVFQTIGQRFDSLVYGIGGCFTTVNVDGCKKFVVKNKDYFHAGAGIVFGAYIISKVYGWFRGDKNKNMRNNQPTVDRRVTNPQRAY